MLLSKLIAASALLGSVLGACSPGIAGCKKLKRDDNVLEKRDCTHNNLNRALIRHSAQSFCSAFIAAPAVSTVTVTIGNATTVVVSTETPLTTVVETGTIFPIRRRQAAPIPTYLSDYATDTSRISSGCACLLYGATAIPGPSGTATVTIVGPTIGVTSIVTLPTSTVVETTFVTLTPPTSSPPPSSTASNSSASSSALSSSESSSSFPSLTLDSTSSVGPTTSEPSTSFPTLTLNSTTSPSSISFPTSILNSTASSSSSSFPTFTLNSTTSFTPTSTTSLPNSNTTNTSPTPTCAPPIQGCVLGEDIIVSYGISDPTDCPILCAYQDGCLGFQIGTDGNVVSYCELLNENALDSFDVSGSSSDFSYCKDFYIYNAGCPWVQGFPTYIESTSADSRRRQLPKRLRA